MADLVAHVRGVFVGLPPDQPSRARLSFYRWLVSTVASRKRVAVRPKDLDVTPEEMRTRPSAIRSQLDEVPDDGGNRSVVVIDLGVNPYHRIRDVFLYYVADTARRWLISRPKQTTIILLPGAGLPTPASLFWHPLGELTDADGSERLIVVANDGAFWSPQGKRPFAAAEYSQHRRESKQTLTELLNMRVVTKMGHYDFSLRAEPHCARYSFDAQQAVREVGDLIVDWVQRRIMNDLPPGTDLTLVSHGKEAVWFHDAVAGAASELGFPFRRLAEDGAPADGYPIEGWVAPVFNVVNTGASFRSVVPRLTALGARVTAEALAVLATEPETSPPPEGTRLHVLCGPHNRERVDLDKCEQCKLNLPYTPATGEEQIGIRAFDMWDILLHVPWGKEEFGAPTRKLYHYVPNMGEVFRKHGNWLAYKVYHLLRSLGVDGEVAFVCPAERHVEVLIDHLGILLQNRQVAIRVTPSLLRVKAGRLRQEADKHQSEDWYRQLKYLQSQHFPKIVMIDETAGSKNTANGMLRLLRSFDLEPVAYIPIIDFSPGAQLRGVSTYPLYQIPNPRSER